MALCAREFWGVARIVTADWLALRDAFPRCRSGHTSPPEVAGLLSYYVSTPGRAGGVDRNAIANWPRLANATAVNHAAFARRLGVPYARFGSTTAHRRCGKMRFVSRELDAARDGTWFLFADADVALRCAPLRLEPVLAAASTDVHLVVLSRFGLFAARATTWSRSFFARFASALESRPALCALSPMPENAAFVTIATRTDKCQILFQTKPAFVEASHLVNHERKRSSAAVDNFVRLAHRYAAACDGAGYKQRPRPPA